MPMNAPSASIAIGVKIAISSSEYFVIHVPTSHTRRTTPIIAKVSRFTTRGYPLP